MSVHPRCTSRVLSSVHPRSFGCPARGARPVARAAAAIALAVACCAGAGPVLAQVADAPAKPDAPVETAKSPWDAPEPWRTDRFYIQTSVYTVHFSSDPDHDNTQELIYGEYRYPTRWLEGQPLVGAAFFDNSFGQSSQFVFGGLLWRPSEKVPEFYIKVAAGVLHGYRGEFQDKIPMNSSGFAPAIVPAVGYCYKRFCGEMILFGTAGLLWTVGMTLP
jgi:hypothetical protein